MFYTNLDIDRDEQINLLQLEIDWQDQPKTFRKYADALVAANTQLRQAEAKRDATEARLYIDIKSNPKKYFEGVEKATDKAVQSMVITQPAYIKDAEVCNAMMERVESLKVMVETMRQRKDALENEVRLHGQNYFATPSVAYGVAKEARKSIDRATETHARNLITRQRK